MRRLIGEGIGDGFGLDCGRKVSVANTQSNILGALDTRLRGYDEEGEGRVKVLSRVDVGEAVDELRDLAGEVSDFVFLHPVFVEVGVEGIGGVEEVDELFVVSFVGKISDDAVEVGVRFVFPATVFCD